MRKCARHSFQMVSLDRRISEQRRTYAQSRSRVPPLVRSRAATAARPAGSYMTHRRAALLVLLSPVVAACTHTAATPMPVVQQGAHVDPELAISAAALRRDLFAFADD